MIDIKRVKVKPEISNEVIEALHTLRSVARIGTDVVLVKAINSLDNAGVFATIDEATGCGIDPAPERVSECTCPVENVRFGGHLYVCPQYPVPERTARRGR